MLICGVMGQDGMKFLPMCLESLKDADKIIYIDGGSKDNSVEFAKSKGCEIIENNYNQDDKCMNGKQRNIFLNYIKEKYPNEWCLFCDCDEVVADLSKIKQFIQTAQSGLYSVKMRHFIGDLGHEDSTVKEHLVLNRLFKISEARDYPLVEHPVLQGNSGGFTTVTTIWHLAYVPNMWDIKKRYDNHMKKSNMHTPKFLKEWYYAHLFGTYPRSPLAYIDIPGVILKEFGIEPDEMYFAKHHTLEVKHFIMMDQWINHFQANNVLDLGCGIGLFGFVVDFLGKKYKGMELSQWAIDHTPFKQRLDIVQGDITKKQDFKDYDFVLVSDVIEHLNEEGLDKTLEIIKGYGKNFLFSTAFEGDPNLYADPTHKIFRPKEWWLEQIGKHFTIKPTPEDWLFKNQLVIGVPK